MKIYTVDRIKMVTVAIAIAGSQTKLAEVFNIKPQAMRYWLAKGVPVKHYLAVYDYIKDAGRLELLTGGDK